MPADLLFDREGLITKFKDEQHSKIPEFGTLMTPIEHIYMWDGKGKAVMCKDKCDISTVWLYLSSEETETKFLHPKIILWHKFLSSNGNIGWTSRIDLMTTA